MKTARGSWERPARVEFLPLLDVIFLVLAVMLYSAVATVRAHVVQVALPELESADTQALSSVLLVSVRADGTLAVGGESLDEAQLEARVAERRSEDPELKVLIHADARAFHGDVARALDRVRAAGQTSVMLVGAPSREPAR